MSFKVSEESIEQERFRLKRLLKKLKAKEGRGTELISLYIPPSRRISEVIRYLRQEYSTSANIKSDITRKNVQDAIVKVIERLKLFKETPETGLAIFCGAIPQNGPGTEKMEIYVIVPPEPINISLYRCDSRFYLEPLEELTREKELYGIVSIDVNEAAIALLEGPRLTILSKHTSGIPGKHRAGGQSARRFERLREMEINEYFKRIAGHVNQAFLPYIDRLSGIIIGGPGFTKEEFAQSKHLDYRVKERIIGYVDTNYSGEEGVREIVERARNLLRETRFLREREAVNKFINEISRRDGLVTYGLESTWQALQMGNVQMILVMENFSGFVIKVHCPVCGYSYETVSRKKPESLSEEKCPSCGRGILQMEIIEFLDYLDEKASSLGFKLMVISPGTEHGKMFEQFGGIGVFLRYRLEY